MQYVWGAEVQRCRGAEAQELLEQVEHLARQKTMGLPWPAQCTIRCRCESFSLVEEGRRRRGGGVGGRRGRRRG